MARSSLVDLCRRFVRLSVLGFGGPVAHIAMMRREFVDEQRWFTNDQFAEMVGVANLIPGPNSTEIAMHVGHERAGLRGLVAAGVSFIVPAVMIVAGCAWLYETHGSSSFVVDLRFGVLPVVVAIVAHAVVSFARGIGRRADAWSVVAFGALGHVAGIQQLVLLAVAAVVVALVAATCAGRWGRLHSFAPAAILPVGIFGADATARELFLTFLKIGSVIYGSGYVLVAYLQEELVDRRQWLTTTQVLDAIAIGQVTPGPVFSTATFIGWQLLGVVGAVVATVGIFAPSFVFVGVITRIRTALQRHQWAADAITGVTWASIGLMAGALLDLAEASLTHPVRWMVMIVSLLLLVTTRLNATWIVTGGVVIGAIHALA